MGKTIPFPRVSRAGIHVDVGADADGLVEEVLGHVGRLASDVEVKHPGDSSRLELRLTQDCETWLAPAGDTLELGARLGLDSVRSEHDLKSEIVLSMLLSPCPLHFGSAAELASAIRVRTGIVTAARETRLDFRTQGAERPDHFTYDDARGFVLREGCSLVDALEHATQPRRAGRRYSFSCWRATEYVLMLAMALETAKHHPELYARLTLQAERRALKGAAFDQAFLRAHGSPGAPLATRYFVPGDRTWFRNPDRASSEVAGFEGCYTFYLGGGRFADFWRDDHTETLLSKCLTLYFWRMSLAYRADGEPYIDEARVDALVEGALADPDETARLLATMERIQDPPEAFEGGCVDPTRDHLRALERTSADLELPDVVDAAERNQSVALAL